MRTRLLFLMLAAMLAACTPVPTSSDSGIYGRVTIGPTCPVVQISDPCPDRPYQATLTVLTAAGHFTVTQFRTDADGYFRVGLAPGAYILHPESPGVMPHAVDIPFNVAAQAYTRLDVVYDSGIR
jgi:hypothetical protein